MSLINENEQLITWEEPLAVPGSTAPWPERQGGKIFHPTEQVLETVTHYLLMNSPNRYTSSDLSTATGIPRPAVTNAMHKAFDMWLIDERTWFLWREGGGRMAEYWYDNSRKRTERPKPLRKSKKQRQTPYASVKNKPLPSSKMGALQSLRGKQSVQVDKPGAKITPIEMYAKIIHHDTNTNMVVLIDQAGNLIKGQYIE